MLPTISATTLSLLTESRRPTRKFHDEEVCKYFLCGFCPYEEFDKTRTDYGPCPAVHDDRCKTHWEALKDEERAKYPYERELKKWLDKMVDDLGKKVKRNQERLDSEANPAFLPDDQVGVSGGLKTCKQFDQHGNAELTPM